MNVSAVIRQRLHDLRLSQQDLAGALQVTESYISQLVTGKKTPPAPERTDLYDKLSKVLHLPGGQLAKLAEAQRREELQKKVAEPPAPLFAEVRELILKKCRPEKAASLRTIFETRPFGELERLATQKLLDVAKRVAREELASEDWLKTVARLSGRKYEEMRVAILEFLDTDVFSISPAHCVSFLDPLIESWDIDLGNFGMEIVLNRRLASESRLRLEFVEQGQSQPRKEPGFTAFLRDRSLSAGVSPEEIAFLGQLQFQGKRPNALYFYREMQNLRDPLHFAESPAALGRLLKNAARSTSIAPMQKHREAPSLAKQLDLETRKAAISRWGVNAKPRQKSARARATRKRTES